MHVNGIGCRVRVSLRPYLVALLCVPVVALAAADAIWARHWSGAQVSYDADSIAAIVSDASGSVYVTGTGGQAGHEDDYVTAKYSEQGVQLWRSFYNGAAPGSIDGAIALVLDNAGDVYVTGTSQESIATFVITTVKYRGTDGAELWRRSLHLRSDPDFGAAGLAYDSVNNRLYACGTVYNDTTFYDYVVVRYDPATGEAIWTQRWNGWSSDEDFCVGIALTGTGANRDPVVAGYYLDDAEFAYDWAVVRCSSATGHIAWARPISWDNQGNDDEEPVGLCTDPNGNIWITGYRYWDPTGYYRFTIARLKNDNTRLDTGTVARGTDNGWGIHCGFARGRIYVIGSFYDAVGGGIYSAEDWGVICYDTTALVSSRQLYPLWARYFDGGYRALGAFSPRPPSEGRKAKGEGRNSSLLPHPFSLSHLRSSVVRSGVAEEPEERDERPMTLAFDPQNRVYVTGPVFREDGQQYWHVQRLDDRSGPPDTMFKLYYLYDTLENHSKAIAVRDTDHIYVGGFTTQVNPYPQWDRRQTLVRFGNVRMLSEALDSLRGLSRIVDSGDVMTGHAFFHNDGAMLARNTFVYLRIGPGFTDSMLYWELNVGDTGSVVFRPCTLRARGTWPVRCTLKLAGDSTRNNNLITDSIFVRVRDAGGWSIVAPAGNYHPGDTVSPRAWVRNFGNVPQDFRVVFRIADSLYADSVSVTGLAPGDSALVSFSRWSAGPIGTLGLVCFTRATGDRNASNDTAYGQVIVLAPSHDVGVSVLLAPTGVIDSGTVVTPQAIVRNYGLVSETFQARFTIGSNYIDTMSASLPAGLLDTLSFAPWLASPVGWFVASCTTLLATDTNPTNNALWDSVQVLPPNAIAEQPSVPLKLGFTGCVPNPIHDAATITYSLAEPGAVNLRLYDVTGHVARVLAVGFHPAGTSSFIVHRSSLSAGVYLLRLETGGNTVTRKLLVE